ncbi:MAG: hypothetical protein LBQ11_00105 [Candidatus Nomurabacteria bacterium]|jgi:hypothetical protein|nr:hypothetical protein [Candidatus Nomurabacteria bacterium]
MSDVSEYIKSQLLLNREAFRAENTEFLRVFTVEDRILCRDLDAIDVSASKFLKAFRDQMMPETKALEDKRDSKTIRAYLTKNFGFSGLDTDVAIDYLVEMRRNQIITSCISEIGGQQNEGKLRNLLNRPIDDLLDLFERYHQYAQALEISEEYGLALIDPHASRIKRHKMKKNVRKDRRKVLSSEKKRLRQIERELGDLFSNNHLLLDIVNKNWSFVEILALNQQYQKILNEVKNVSPAGRLEVFEEVTADFRRDNIETLTVGNNNLNLKELQALSESVYNLLLEVFDMDNTSRNRLMIDVKTYSGLVNEREQLLLARRNAQEFLES